MMRITTTAAMIAAALGAAAVRGQAQDTTASSSSPRAQSVVGSARVWLDATYVREQYSVVQASGTYAPFINERWQLGISPAVGYTGGNGDHYFSGAGAVIANYFPLDGSTSRPYIGVFAGEGGGSGSNGNGTLGLQAGWLHFLSPAVAFRAELRYRSFTDTRAYHVEDLFIGIDPYLFGRANQSLTSLPGFGVFDAAILGDFQLHPTRVLTLDGTVAPFLTRYLQTGLGGNFLFDFFDNSGVHQLEWFGRAYLPIDTRIVPFGDGFLASRFGSSDFNQSSHGARAGLRAYLTAGVALDVAFEWRNFSPLEFNGARFVVPQSRALHAALTTQFRAIRGRH